MVLGYHLRALGRADDHEDDLKLLPFIRAIRYRFRNPLFCLGLLACAFLACAFVSGCVLNPDRDPCKDCGVKPLPVYPILSDPYNVMTAYRLAYEARDSVEMKLIYDDAYQGESIDQSNPGDILHLYFSKAQEVSHVGAMAKVPTINGVSLQLPGSLLRETDVGSGWAMIQLPPGTVRLQIDDAGTSYVIVSDKESFEFKFVPTTPDSTSPTDTTWKIIRWSELRL